MGLRGRALGFRVQCLGFGASGLGFMVFMDFAYPRTHMRQLLHNNIRVVSPDSDSAESLIFKHTVESPCVAARRKQHFSKNQFSQITTRQRIASKCSE